MKVEQVSITKLCSKCRTKQPVGCFCRDSKRKDGLSYNCKQCSNERVKKWNAENKAHRAAYMAQYYRKHEEKLKKRSGEYQRVNRERRNLYSKEWLKNPKNYELHQIRVKVNTAIRSGRLVPEGCRVCGKAPAQAHHDDYNKPLDVTWLCPPHHAAWHRVFVAEVPR